MRSSKKQKGKRTNDRIAKLIAANAAVIGILLILFAVMTLVQQGSFATTLRLFFLLAIPLSIIISVTVFLSTGARPLFGYVPGTISLLVAGFFWAYLLFFAQGLGIGALGIGILAVGATIIGTLALGVAWWSKRSNQQQI